MNIHGVPPTMLKSFYALSSRSWKTTLSWWRGLHNSMKLWAMSHAMQGHSRQTGHNLSSKALAVPEEFWQNMVQWRSKWQPTPVFFFEEPHGQYKKSKKIWHQKMSPRGWKVSNKILGKSGGELLIAPVCQQIWNTQQWPQSWKRSVFISNRKEGQCQKKCSNYQRIAFILHANKIMFKIFQASGNCSNKLFQALAVPELRTSRVQAGFRKGSGTRD